jgi:hypothetical protein
MAERRPLTEGIKPPAPPVDPQRERDFLQAAKSTAAPASTAAVQSPFARVPISTRIRSEYADALKRASLERQLNKVEPNTLQDILEQAIEPWLRSNGYIR